MKKKIGFVLPPIILAILTWIWLFYKDGRYYEYNNEFLFKPLFFLHFVLPIFYFIAMIVSIVRLINPATRTMSNVFYLITSIIFWLFGVVGLIAYFIITSGV